MNRNNYYSHKYSDLVLDKADLADIDVVHLEKKIENKKNAISEFGHTQCARR